ALLAVGVLLGVALRIGTVLPVLLLPGRFRILILRGIRLAGSLLLVLLLGSRTLVVLRTGGRHWILVSNIFGDFSPRSPTELLLQHLRQRRFQIQTAAESITQREQARCDEQQRGHSVKRARH